MLDRECASAPSNASLGTPDDLRLADGVVLAAGGDGRITLYDPATNATTDFDVDTLPLLERFTTWISATALVEAALDGGGGEEVARMLDVVARLMRSGVLTIRREDWAGHRLPVPGEGWRAALQFFHDTRTTRRTRFAAPAEFNEALALKSIATCHQPSAFYERTDAPFHALPPALPAAEPGPSFERVMRTRRTARRYSNHPLSEADLSSLLFFGWGMVSSVPNPLGDAFVRKTSPSGGSLHPIEVYPVVLNVDGVAPGCYHYSVRRHGLERISQGLPAPWIVDACADQAWVAEAGVIFLTTAFLPRSAWKYDYARVGRAVMFEAGYSAQSALLAAAWLGLGAFTTAALRDEIFEEKLGIDPAREIVLSVTGAGRLEPDRSDHSRPRYETSHTLSSP